MEKRNAHANLKARPIGGLHTNTRPIYTLLLGRQALVMAVHIRPTR